MKQERKPAERISSRAWFTRTPFVNESDKPARVPASVLLRPSIFAASVAIVLLPMIASPLSSPQAEPQEPAPHAAAAAPALPVAAFVGKPKTQTSLSAGLADEGAKLLQMATDLKSEVDKTTPDTLSLGVIRKANEIEKLARDVREKMKNAPETKP